MSDKNDFKNRNLKNRNSDLSSIVYGKIPPQAIELEQAVLGAIMIDKDAMQDIATILTHESFYDSRNSLIYKAIHKLYSHDINIDLLTVTEELRKMGELENAGGPFYITNLTSRVGSAAHIEEHARIVEQKNIQRKIIRIGTLAVHDAYEDTDDVFELMERLEQDFAEINSTLVSNEIYHVSEVGKQIKKEFADRAARNTSPGIPIGYKEIDEDLGEMQKGDLVIWAGRASMGKCLGAGTKILLFDGTLKEVEKIKVDELLMGPDSKPRRVLSTCSGTDKMYLIKQSKGIDYRVNESHILSLKSRKQKNVRKTVNGRRVFIKSEPINEDAVVNISIADYQKKSKKWKREHKGYKVGVDFCEQPLTIDPYFLGLWLGDGTSSTTAITAIEKEIVDYLKDFAKEINLKIRSEVRSPTSITHYITSCEKNKNSNHLKKWMQSIHLLNNKHIPKSYLINSRENRLKLLAGIIDTDGHLSCGCYEIVQKNKKLAEQIKFIADTLGFRTSIKPKRAVLSSRNYETNVYKVIISGRIWEIPVKIKRKKFKEHKLKRNPSISSIKVEYDKIDTYFGFELDGDGLFLLEDMTVTHNTAMMVCAAINQASQGITVGIISMEMTRAQLFNRFICHQTGIPVKRLNRNNIYADELEKMDKAERYINSLPIYIEDSSNPSISQFKTRCMRMKRKYGVDIIYGDHLGKMTIPKETNDYIITSTAVKTCKAVAKSLDIPVVMLSQLSRKTEQMKDMKPMLSHLRDSGKIEEEADVVALFYRPEYYDRQGIKGFDKIFVHGRQVSSKGFCEANFVKNRNGEVKPIHLTFISESMKFLDYDETYYKRDEEKQRINANKNKSEGTNLFEDEEPF